LFDIGTKKASIENYLDYEDDADRNFMAVVLKKIEDQQEKDLIKFFSIVDLILVIDSGLSSSGFAERMLQEKEKDETLWVDNKIFYEWQYLFDVSKGEAMRKIAFEKMLDIAKRVKSDPELWLRVYTSTDDKVVKKMIEEEVKANDTTFKQWLRIYLDVGSYDFVFDKLVSASETYDEWEIVLSWARENEDKKNIELALSEMVKCLN
jgi:hypothetical protein